MNSYYVITWPEHRWVVKREDLPTFLRILVDNGIENLKIDPDELPTLSLRDRWSWEP